MAYTPTVWKDGDVITAERMNKLEQGVKNGQVGPQGEPGKDGVSGRDGADGKDGAPGVGVPAGGDAGQMLTKNSAVDYDTAWVNLPTPEPGTIDHAQLENRDAANQHPISSITGLQEAIDTKQATLPLGAMGKFLGYTGANTLAPVDPPVIGAPIDMPVLIYVISTRIRDPEKCNFGIDGSTENSAAMEAGTYTGNAGADAVVNDGARGLSCQ